MRDSLRGVALPQQRLSTNQVSAHLAKAVVEEKRHASVHFPCASRSTQELVFPPLAKRVSGTAIYAMHDRVITPMRTGVGKPENNV
jgi:hypothetical protein